MAYSMSSFSALACASSAVEMAVSNVSIVANTYQREGGG
jgi:hypothetical protein